MEQIMLEMLKNQSEYCKIYKQQQIKKKQELNKIQKSKEYYGNSKEYKKLWNKNGAMINK